jgi:exodeoxyribonuclease-3
MKLATLNINGVNGRLSLLLDWLAETSPDVVCLQEIKCIDSKFPAAALERAGYGAIWRGEKTWNGVALLARGAQPIESRRALPAGVAAPPDLQARYIEAAVGGVIVACLYAPNGNPQPGPKFDYKLAWMDRLAQHAAELFASGLPVVLAGDYNVVPTDLDIYKTTSYDDNALLQPESRAAFATLLTQGWVDAIRKRHPRERIYTFWDYKRNRWPRDAGLRIDHLLLSKSVAKRLTGAGVDKAVRGREGASDHAPVWITLR